SGAASASACQDRHSSRGLHVRVEGFVQGASNVGFVIVPSLGTLAISILVGAVAAGNALVMSIMARLGDFAGIDQSVIGTVCNAIGPWFGNVLPTNAILMAGLGVAAVGFDKYLRFMMPRMGIWVVLQLLVFATTAL